MLGTYNQLRTLYTNGCEGVVSDVDVLCRYIVRTNRWNKMMVVVGWFLG